MDRRPITTLCSSSFSPQFNRVTHHPFLAAAGEGRISKAKLSQWLSQDRLYAQSYVRFIGLLLSKVQLPAGPPRQPTTEGRVFDVLVESLVNIQRELRFFEDTAVEYGLDLTAPPDEDDDDDDGAKNLWRQPQPDPLTVRPTPTTRAYIDLFMSAASPAASLLEGMLVLYATEYCYFYAWKFAALHQSASRGPATDADGGALRQKFIPNWASDEFSHFVTRLQGVTDELGAQIKDAQAFEKDRSKCLVWWKQVLWLEERFWPPVESAQLSS
jgi:thiaminase